MTTLRELYSYFDGLFPKSLSCDWDNDGLMVSPAEDAAVRKVLISLDVTEQVSEYAKAGGFDVIISHHPLIFHKLPALSSDCVGASLPLSLYSEKISVMSFHTRFDAAKGGMNDTLAEMLGITPVSTFGPDGEEVGRLCRLPEAIPFSSLCNRVKNTLGAPNICASKSGEFSKEIALLGGDGKDFISAAIKSGADTFITGGASYNSMLDARASGLSVIEAGHYYTEFPPFATRISGLLSEAFPEISARVCPVGCEILYI